MTEDAGQAVRQRGSSPKLQVLNTALMSAQSGYTFDEARVDRTFWARLVESAVGAHLANEALAGQMALHYWRDRGREIDFVTEVRRRVSAIEVKSGSVSASRPGIEAFTSAFGTERTLLVGGDGIRPRQPTNVLLLGVIQDIPPGDEAPGFASALALRPFSSVSR